ncbi:unnamed protein product, partial [Caretta caretta]
TGWAGKCQSLMFFSFRESGGPLVCDGVVQGIVSNGYLDMRHPSIYTRITKCILWINETLQKPS